MHVTTLRCLIILAPLKAFGQEYKYYLQTLQLKTTYVMKAALIWQRLHVRNSFTVFKLFLQAAAEPELGLAPAECEHLRSRSEQPAALVENCEKPHPRVGKTRRGSYMKPLRMRLCQPELLEEEQQN